MGDRDGLPGIISLRLRLGLTQAQFAAAFGLSLRTVQGWERHPERVTGAALVLLRVIEAAPDVVRGIVSKK